MSLLDVTNAHRRYKERATRENLEDLRERVGRDYRVAPFSMHDYQTMIGQWPKEARRYPHWEWLTIYWDHSGPRDWCFSIRVGDRLCVLAAAKMRNSALTGEFLEADPRPDCPLKGARALIGLDLMARYAEYAKAKEFRIVPENATLARYYGTLVKLEPFPNAENPSYYRVEL